MKMQQKSYPWSIYDAKRNWVRGPKISASLSATAPRLPDHITKAAENNVLSDALLFYGI
jgi:hypothetical protein